MDELKENLIEIFNDINKKLMPDAEATETQDVTGDAPADLIRFD